MLFHWKLFLEILRNNLSKPKEVIQGRSKWEKNKVIISISLTIDVGEVFIIIFNELKIILIIKKPGSMVIIPYSSPFLVDKKDIVYLFFVLVITRWWLIRNICTYLDLRVDRRRDLLINRFEYKGKENF